MAAATPLLLFLCAAISAAAQQMSNIRISLESSLSPTNTNTAWLSPSGVFGFGFHRTPNGYVVGIFFDLFNQKTVVWTANRENPIVPTNVVLILTDDGLVLKKLITQETYSLIANSSQPTAWASMLDNGNFVLYNSNGSAIWQSFDHPTDTLLPGQRLPPEGELISRASESDFTIGTSNLKMQSDGNLVLYYVNSLNEPGDSYYSSGTYGGGNISLNLENDGHLYLASGDFSMQDLTRGGNPVDRTVYIARLDWDGIIRLYNRSLQQEGNWKLIWSVTDDKCSAKGLCGINSYCTYKDQNADCKCLPGFSAVVKGQWSAGCRGNFMVDCMDKDQSRKYEMVRVLNVSWEDNYYSASRGVSEERCEKGCLVDCNCIIALFRDGECRKQKLPLSYGRWFANVSDMAFVRVAISTPTNPGSGRGNLGHKTRILKTYAITAVLLGILGPIMLYAVIYYYVTRPYGWYNEGNGNKEIVDKFVLKHGSLAPKRYSSKEIKKITKSYADKLGQGGYGVVYQGKLPDGQLVAVKVLKKTNDNAEEFINEVASISRTSHVNIVNLLGFCYERKKKALVYEFMPNKSLDKFMYKSRSVDPECSLEWKKLYEIAVGVARGLEYLHRGCNTRIVHFDIKPQNILLDEVFCPKISDFGLAKLCVKKQSVISMLGTRGTIGYIAPEVFSRNFGVVSHKSDVYSYGIMLLQMAEARTNVEIKSSSENYSLEMIYELLLVKNEKIYGVMTEEEEEAVRKMLMVGFWCIQTAPLERPSMNNVVDMLEGNLQSIKIPPLPFLLSSPKPHDFNLLCVTVETLSSNEVSYC